MVDGRKATALPMPELAASQVPVVYGVWLSWDDFGKPGWATGQFSRNPPEIIEEVMNIGGEVEPGTMCKRVLKGCLKGTEETTSTRDGRHHGA